MQIQMRLMPFDAANASIPENLEYFKSLFLAKVTTAVNTAEQGGGGSVHFLTPVALVAMLYCICACGSSGADRAGSVGDEGGNDAAAVETRDGKQYIGLQSVDAVERGGSAAGRGRGTHTSYQSSEISK